MSDGFVCVADTGYTKVCPLCCERWSENKALVGRPRVIDAQNCVKCTHLTKMAKDDPHFVSEYDYKRLLPDRGVK